MPGHSARSGWVSVDAFDGGGAGLRFARGNDGGAALARHDDAARNRGRRGRRRRVRPSWRGPAITGAGWCRRVIAAAFGRLRDDRAAFRPGVLSGSRRSASGLAGSRTTSFAALSSRKPRNTAWRKRPAPDHPANEVSATRSGFTQWMVCSSSIAGDHQVAGRSGSQSVEAVAQHRQRLVGEPGADTAGVVQLSLRIVIAQVERAEPGAAAAGSVQPTHDEFLSVGALDFEPVTAATGAVGAVGLLADDALRVSFAGARQHANGVTLLVVAVAQHAVPGGEAFQHGPCDHAEHIFGGPNRRDKADRRDRRTR